MRLSFSEAVGYLGVSESTARRWIRSRGFPVHHAEERMFVNAVELWEWAQEQGLPVSRALLDRERRSREDVAPISVLLEAGGIHHDVPGSDKKTVLREIVKRLPLPDSLDRQSLAAALDAREAMGSTGLGHGIAIPHVRNPIVLQVNEPIVSLCLLSHSIDFQAVDGEPVHALFTIVSPTIPSHLRILARLGFVLQDDGLRKLLESRSAGAAIMQRIRELEARVALPPNPGRSGDTR